MKSKFHLVLVLCACSMAFVSAASASNDVRLSRTLIPTEYEEAGLKHLNSDQIAILDALVRRDTAILSRPAPVSEPRAERFSQRISADELNNAGLALLSENELSQLDAYIARLTAPIGSPTGSFASGQGKGRAWITEKTLRRPPEIHGSITLMYGQGRDGYSERGGAMVLTYDDPSGISLAVGYSEIKTKGGHPYRHYYPYYRDRYYGSGIGLGWLSDSHSFRRNRAAELSLDRDPLTPLP